jgi:nucleotidyltransferase substrate binding protein (TIGR01987 family)
MEKLAKKYNNLVKIHQKLAIALRMYKEALADKSNNFDMTEAIRDSVIKRFELTYELLWKYLREYMITAHGVSIDSPRKVFQECLSLSIIDESETEELIDLVEDRNLTAHVYDMDLANQVANDIQKHHDVIRAVIEKVSLDTIKK